MIIDRHPAHAAVSRKFRQRSESRGVKRVKFRRILALWVLWSTSAFVANAQDLHSGVAELIAGRIENGLKILLPLAEQGEVEAMAHIAMIYDNGSGIMEGIMPDHAQTLKWLRLAAKHGHPFSQSQLGQMYQFGKGVLQNNLMAHMWYNIASANGEIFGADMRDRIALKMSPDAIEKAQAMARECMRSGYQNCGE